MEDGVFSFGHPLAEKLGFTEERFDGYLAENEGYIYISFIISKQPNQGHLSQLFDRILEHGYGIKVPTPFPLMKKICEVRGFKQTLEHDRRMGLVEVWFFNPPRGSYRNRRCL